MNPELKARLSERAALAHLMQAYMELIEMPHGALRARQQSVMDALRDAIAFEMGHSSQFVQDTFEEMALKKRLAA